MNKMLTEQNLNTSTNTRNHTHANQSEAAREPGQRPLLAFKAHRHATGPFSTGLLALCMEHHMARLLAFTCSTPKQHPHKKNTS